jgi:hypothetical protein
MLTIRFLLNPDHHIELRLLSWMMPFPPANIIDSSDGQSYV